MTATAAPPPVDVFNSGTAARVRGRLNAHRYRTDPVGWAKERLGVDLWSKQQEIAAAVVDAPHVAVRSCHSAGKSFLAATLAAWWVDVHPPKDTLVVTTAPTGDQVKLVIWGELSKAHEAGNLPGVITTGNQIWRIGNDVVAVGRKPADSPDEAQAMQTFQGLHRKYLLVILDEACGIDPYLFNGAYTLATDPVNHRILAIGNPDDPTSYFAEACAPDSPWRRIKIAADDTPNFTGEQFTGGSLLTPQWVENQQRMPGWNRGGAMFTSKILAEFPDSSVDTLISRTLLDRAHQTEHSGIAPGCYSIDIGGDGPNADHTVIYRNRGGVIRLEDEWSGLDTVQTVDRVRRLVPAPAGCPPIVVDTNGIGMGVRDQLRAAGYRVVSFKGGEKPVGDLGYAPEHFVNRRAEVFWALRDKIEKGLIDLDRDDLDLSKELLQIKWKVVGTDGKKIQMESKDLMVSSPDRADAVSMSLVAADAARVRALDQHGLPAQPLYPTELGSSVGTLTGDLLERAM